MIHSSTSHQALEAASFSRGVEIEKEEKVVCTLANVPKDSVLEKNTIMEAGHRKRDYNPYNSIHFRMLHCLLLLL